MTRRRKPLIDRLMSRVREDENGCWIFMGAIDTTGYGRIGVGGRGEGITHTHRVTYAYFVAEIPEGLHIDHLCRVRACCNPWHLEPVSQAENNRRAVAANGPKPACRQGHPFTPENTRQAPRQRHCRTCDRLRATESMRSTAA